VKTGSEPSQGKSQVLNENAAFALASSPTEASASTSAPTSSTALGSTPGTSEKRRVERTRTGQLLYVELGTGNGGILLDVSEEGCGFLSIAPIWDEQPHFAFAIGGGRQIQGDGKVVWVDKSKKLGGLRFVNASPAFRQQVRTWLAKPTVDAPQRESKAESRADILKATEPKPIERKLIEAPGDSPAKQRRKQLREEARAKMEAAEHAWQRESGEQGDLGLEHTHPPGQSFASVEGMHEQIFLHGPSQRSWPAFLTNRRLWKGVAGFVVGGAVAALGVAYHQQAGTALMRLGTSLAGRQEQVTSAADSTAGGSAPTPVQGNPAPVETKQAAPHVKPLVNDAVERKPEGASTGKNAEPAKQVQQAAVIAPEAKSSPRNATPSASTNVEGSLAPPVVRKLSPTATEPTLQKRSGPLQATAAAPPAEPKKRAPYHATAEQVQALWSEVEGGDVSAEVALGELYARGNGVPKSCGQARMLLNSAAKKGSDEARQKLEQLADAGCP
jgi:hypothetical protein